MRLTALIFLVLSLFLPGCTPDTEGEGGDAGAMPSIEAGLEDAPRRTIVIGLGTDAVRGVEVGLDDKKQGRSRLFAVRDLTDAAEPRSFLEDGTIDAAERAELLARMDSTLQTAGPGPVAVRLDMEYTDVTGLFDLMGELKAVPRVESVVLNTPRLDARANLAVLAGRTDLPLNDVVVIDIGSRVTTFSALPTGRWDSLVVTSLDIGSRNLLDRIDPLLEFRVENDFHRRRMMAEVDELLQVQLRLLLRRPAFDRQQKYVLMGGLAYKLIRMLDLPLERYALMPFASDRNGDNMLRFQQMVLQDSPALANGPDYTRPELYAAHRFLEIILDEVGRDGQLYFFERSTNLPGHGMLVSPTD